ncbi:MAG: AIR synthase-related protein [Candidatus Bathyarchaeia archaeon]
MKLPFGKIPVDILEKVVFKHLGYAKPGDKIILTKHVGIEGTAILATEKDELKRALEPTLLQSAKKFYNKISVVKDALIAVKTGGVHAMHDPTEGGISGGIHEMAEASKVGFQVCEEKIPIQLETRKICEYFKIDPLQLISSGALLISVEPEFAEKNN